MYIQTGGTGGAIDATPDASDAIFVFGSQSMPDGVEIGDSVRVTGGVSDFGGTVAVPDSLTEITPDAGGVVELEHSARSGHPARDRLPDDRRGAREARGRAARADRHVHGHQQLQHQQLRRDRSRDRRLRRSSSRPSSPSPAAPRSPTSSPTTPRVRSPSTTASSTNYLSNQTTKAHPAALAHRRRTARPSRRRRGSVPRRRSHSPVIMDFRNSIWKFQPRQQVTGDNVYPGTTWRPSRTTRAANLTPPNVGGDITIATFNVLNFFNTTGEAYAAAGPLQNPPLDTRCTYFTDRGEQPDRQQLLRCAEPRRPGHAGQRGEHQQRQWPAWCGDRGEPGAPGGQARPHDQHAGRRASSRSRRSRTRSSCPGETNRDDAVAYVVNLLNAAAGGTKWKYVKSPGEALTAGRRSREQDVIRPAFIYQPALVTPVGQSDILFGTTQFANAREPLAQAFKAAERPTATRSRSSSTTSSPRATTPRRPRRRPETTPTTRTSAPSTATACARPTGCCSSPTTSPPTRDIEAVFLAGDFNAYTEEAPIKALEVRRVRARSTPTTRPTSPTRSAASPARSTTCSATTPRSTW